jgi:SAM-dependent methyltransferase
MQAPPAPIDPWAAGQPYEYFMGRWSRALARAFMDWLAPPPNLHWLDLGCGTGALSETILTHAAPASLLGIDSSAGFIAFARRHIADPRAAFQVGSALELPPLPRPLDAAVSGLVLNFIPDPLAALQALAQVLRPGGVLAVYVWDYAGRMEMLRYFWDSAVALDRAARSLDEGLRFPLCRPEALTTLFTRANLNDIHVSALEIATPFASFDDYWSPFLGGQGPAPSYVAQLPLAARAALEAHLSAALPSSVDGSIPLVARAWAVRARAPG